MRSMTALTIVALNSTAIVGLILGAAEVPAAAAGGATDLLDPAYVARQVCGPIPTQRTELYKPGFQMAAAAGGAAAGAKSGPPLYDTLGQLTYPISTRSAEAQAYFDQGLRLAFAFNHGEAARAFRQAQAIDPTCAMCYWGEAYVLGPNINFPMMPEAVATAFAAIARALALKARASERERALIDALGARYSADPAADRPSLERAYAEAMSAVAARWPDDDQVQVLLADALMNLQPWDYWEADRTTPKGRTAEQIAALERVSARHPTHPGAIHLYIHTVEASTTPERAEPFADLLGAQMPGAGHLVHMPAHIYYRVGRYLDSLQVNVAAARRRGDVRDRNGRGHLSLHLLSAQRPLRPRLGAHGRRRAEYRRRSRQAGTGDVEGDGAASAGSRRSSRRPTSPTPPSARPRRCWPCRSPVRNSRSFGAAGAMRARWRDPRRRPGDSGG